MKDIMKEYRNVRTAKKNLLNDYRDKVGSLGFDLNVSIDSANGYKLVAQLKSRDEDNPNATRAKSMMPKKCMDVKVETIFGRYDPPAHIGTAHSGRQSGWRADEK